VNTSDAKAFVFLEYTQAELDAAYDQTVYAPNHELVRRRINAMSERARSRLAPSETFSYGAGSVEQIEFFRTDRPAAPIFVFIHGGAWKTNSAARFAFIAEPLVDAGAHCALVEFSGVETVDGRLSVVVEQVQRAVRWIVDNAERLGGDPAKIYLAGHSSGSHLAATVLTHPASAELPIQGAILCSGMYDLEPVSRSHRSGYVRFDAGMVREFSPIRYAQTLSIPIVIAYGTEETPEFQRQSRDFAAVLKEQGKDVRLIVADACNHFEIAETFANPFGLLGRAAIELLSLRTG
jgi:arylformamidase